MPDLNQLLDKMPIPDVGEAKLYIWNPGKSSLFNLEWGHMALEFNSGGSLILSPHSVRGRSLQSLADEVGLRTSSRSPTVNNGYVITPHAAYYVNDPTHQINDLDRLTFGNNLRLIPDLLNKLKFDTDITHIEHHVLKKQHIEIIKRSVDYKGYVLLMAKSPIQHTLQTLMPDLSFSRILIFTNEAVYYVDGSDKPITYANKIEDLTKQQISNLLENLGIGEIPPEGTLLHTITDPGHALTFLKHVPYPTCANGPVSYVSFWPSRPDKTGTSKIRPLWHDKGRDLAVYNNTGPDRNFLLRHLNLKQMQQKIIELKNNPNVKYKFLIKHPDLNNYHYNCVSIVLNLLKTAGVEKITGKNIFLAIGKFYDNWEEFMISWSIILVISSLISSYPLMALELICVNAESPLSLAFGLLCIIDIIYLLLCFGMAYILLHTLWCGRKSTTDLLKPLECCFCAVILLIPFMIVTFAVALIIALFYCILRELITGCQCATRASANLRNILSLSPDSTTIQELLESLRENCILVDDPNDIIPTVSSVDESTPIFAASTRYATTSDDITDIETGRLQPNTSTYMQGTMNEDDNRITVSTGPNPSTDKTENSTMNSSPYGYFFSDVRDERKATVNTRNWCAIL